MAHRRTMGGRKLAAGAVAMLMVAVMLAGSVYVSNRVTGLRARIAGLESQRKFLEAGSARLQTDWNKQTAPTVIISRAEAELGLVTSTVPALVLVQRPASGDRTSVWRRWLDNVGGAQAAQAAVLPPAASGTMISLSPRPRNPQGES